MNRYSSREQTLYARNVMEKVISPPSNLAIVPATDMIRQVFSSNGLAINSNSNAVCKRVGIFCNFADGLVFKDPFGRLNVNIYAYGCTLPASPLAGDINGGLAGQKDIIGLGTSWNTALNVGDLILITGLTGQQITYVKTITDATHIQLSDYLRFTPLNGKVYKYAINGSAAFTFYDMAVMNAMHSCDVYLRPSQYANASTNAIVFAAQLWSANNFEFLTKSANPAFAGDTAFFDAVIDLEYTAI